MEILKTQQDEKYTFVQIMVPYDQRYGDDTIENQKEQIDAALDSFC